MLRGIDLIAPAPMRPQPAAFSSGKQAAATWRVPPALAPTAAIHHPEHFGIVLAHNNT